MDELLQDFPVVVELPVVWGEMDARQHVNNAVYFRYFESARIAYFEKLGFWQQSVESGQGVILGAVSCRYRFPLTFPDTISVAARVIKIEADRFTIAHRIVSHRHQKIAAEGEAVMVSYNYRELKKMSLPELIKQGIQAVEGRDLS